MTASLPKRAETIGLSGDHSRKDKRQTMALTIKMINTTKMLIVLYIVHDPSVTLVACPPVHTSQFMLTTRQCKSPHYLTLSSGELRGSMFAFNAANARTPSCT